MSEQAKVDAPKGQPIVLETVWGLTKAGKPFHAINLRDTVDDGRAMQFTQGVLGILAQASDSELIALGEKARKARLWYVTHKAEHVRDAKGNPTGDVKLIDRVKGPATSDDGKIRGETF